jgi:hypothetical protein
MHANFLLGSLKITEPAKLVLKRIPLDLIARHAVNEHGLVTPREQRANEKGMRTVGLIISRYKADPTNPESCNIIIKTHPHWDETTVSVE